MSSPMAGRDPNYVIVIGGGRVGYYLAKELMQTYEVLIIEQDAARAGDIASSLGTGVTAGDGCEAAVLEEAGCERAAMLIAVTGDDEDNLVACQVAKNKFGVPKTIARLSDPRNEELFKALGIDVTVSATEAILSKIEMELPISGLSRLLQLQHSGYDVVEVRLSDRAPAVGMAVKDLLLPQGALIVLLFDRDETPRLPSGDSVLRGGDHVIAITRTDAEDALRRVLTGERVG